MLRRRGRGNSRLVYAQTAVAHKEYFYYVYSFFKDLFNDYTPQLRIGSLSGSYLPPFFFNLARR